MFPCYIQLKSDDTTGTLELSFEAKIDMHFYFL